MMNKTDIIKTVSKKTGFSQKDINEVVECILESISEGLANDNEINFSGFGKFYVQNRDARKGINPKTLESIDIPATRVPKFKAGSALKSVVAI